MKKYKVTLKQMNPVEVWADDKYEALGEALAESEWVDDYEVLEDEDAEELEDEEC